MQGFKYIHGQLHGESVPVAEIAREVETPFYLYSKGRLLHNFRRISGALQGIDSLVCYALKANSNPSILSLLAEVGAGADVVSRGEVHWALKSGFASDKIFYAGVGKTDSDIRYALEQNIGAFHVESGQELGIISRIASELGKTARVGIRVNPDVDIHGHPYIATGKAQDKFGIALSEVRSLVSQFEQLHSLRLVGLHCHLGSQVQEATPYVAAIRALADLKTDLPERGATLEYVDIGGGFGVDYQHPLEDDGGTPSRILAEIAPELKQLNCRILIEPGRSIVASAGVLVSRVLYRKETRGKQFLIVDAGMNDLIRPSLYQAYHAIIPVQASSKRMAKMDVVGPICESGDFMGKDRQLPELERDDLIAVMTAGAYGFSLSSNYNSRPRPAEILVDGDSWRIIRERESLDDLWGKRM